VITFAAGRSHLLGLVKEVDQRITTNAISINPWGDWCARAAAHHADEITLGWKHVNHWRALDQIGLARLARKVRDIKGRMKVMAGNADNPDEVRWLLEAGITQIFTNRVSMVKRIVG
jgi:glycerophosphoryl diester phosphodiesterase